MVAHPERDAECQRTLLVGRATVDPDMSGRPDRLEVPGVAPPAEHALDVAKLGLPESDLAMSSPADPNRPKWQLDHSVGGIASTLDLQERGFRHRVVVSCLRFREFRSRDPGG